MLATAWPNPFAGPGWHFEPKWDGIRGVLAWDGRVVTLHTRTDAEVSARYPELAPDPHLAPCVVDGEVVVLAGGRASFERLQQRAALTPAGMRDHPVSFVAFDLLHLGARSLLGTPIEERRRLLDGLGLGGPFVTVAPVADGTALWEVVVGRDLEGMVAKRAASPYRPGVRSADWRKVAHLHTVKAVVGGFTPGEGGRSGSFGALALGLWDGLRLRWIGNVGSGFGDRQLEAIRGALDEMRRPHSAFHPDPELPAMTAVEPALVAAVDYRNWTTAGRIRHPRFKGFTDDAVDAVTWEQEGPDRVVGPTSSTLDP
jgi:bifunctional non-homologous end joining protein LigD